MALHRMFACCAILSVSRVSTGAAQPLHPVSIEFNVGLGFSGSSAPYLNGRGFEADALVGSRLGLRREARARAAGGFVIALSASGRVSEFLEASCDVVPGGHCTPDFPTFSMLSTLAGWESGSGGARFLAGPAVARSSSTMVGAMQARVELAQPIVGRLSLLVSGRIYQVPSYRGDAFTLGAAGIGVRLR